MSAGDTSANLAGGSAAADASASVAGAVGAGGALAMAWSIRARRNPLTIAGLWAWRTVLASLVGGPAAVLVGQAFPAPPRGDTVLWDPGAHALMVFVLREAHGLRAIAREAAMVLAIGAIVGLLPMAIAMVAIAHGRGGPLGRRTALGRSAAVAIRRLPALVRLAIVMTTTQAAIVGAAALLGHIATAVGSNALGEARAELAGDVVAMTLAPAFLAVGVAHDLARAAVVRSRVGATRAFFVGVGAWRAAPLGIGWAWAWRSSAGLVPVLLASLLASRIGGVQGAFPLLALAIAHQAAVGVRIAFHVSWLAKALRSVGP
jgi:hypothetical protein